MLKLLLGDPNARKLKRYQPIVTEINLLEDDIASLIIINNCSKVKAEPNSNPVHIF